MYLVGVVPVPFYFLALLYFTRTLHILESIVAVKNVNFEILSLCFPAPCYKKNGSRYVVCVYVCMYGWMDGWAPR
jgi:hypothetical protein